MLEQLENEYEKLKQKFWEEASDTIERHEKNTKEFFPDAGQEPELLALQKKYFPRLYELARQIKELKNQ